MQWSTIPTHSKSDDDDEVQFVKTVKKMQIDSNVARQTIPIINHQPHLRSHISAATFPQPHSAAPTTGNSSDRPDSEQPTAPESLAPVLPQQDVTTSPTLPPANPARRTLIHLKKLQHKQPFILEPTNKLRLPLQTKIDQQFHRMHLSIRYPLRRQWYLPT